MKTSLVISVSVHAAILAFATIAFPSAKPFEVEPMKTLPVDIVDASELTRLKAGKKDAKPEPEKAKPKQPVEAAKPAEEPKKEPPKKVAALPPEPPKAPEAPKVATPAPTPPELRPRAEPKPEPVPAPEPKKAEVKPQPKPKEEPKTLVSNEPVPVPDLKPPRKPAPKQQAQQKPKERKFDADRIAALLNKVPDQTASNPPPQPDVVARAEPGLGDPRGQDAVMSINEIDALRAQIAQCWNPPIGIQGAAELAVRLNIALNPDGTVAAEPQLLSSGQGIAFDAAADSARRAVLRCQPYQLPPEKYEAWREINVNFDPRELLGG